MKTDELRRHGKEATRRATGAIQGDGHTHIQDFDDAEPDNTAGGNGGTMPRPRA